MVKIFYWHNVVGGVVNCTNDIYGGTLPVLKNEIKDFFFARLGTGSIYGLPLRMRTNAYKIVKAEYFYECESDDLCINMYTPSKRMMGRGNIQNVYIIFL